MKRVLFLAVLMFALVACSKSQTAENAAQELIGYMNQDEYTKIWTTFVSEKSKGLLAKDLEELKKNPLGVILFQTVGINEDALKTLTVEEYFTKTTMFYNDLIKSKEKTDKIIEKVEVKGDKGIIYWKQGETTATLPIIKQNKKWYMDFEQTK